MDRHGLELKFRVAQAVAREAGDLALWHYRRLDDILVEEKGPQDLVSAADREAEALIRERLLGIFPDDGFLGEEGGAARLDAEAVWVVDPIDGTRNFVTGVPVWCVSIGLVVGGESVLGVIAEPVAGALYAAAKGMGATRDGRPIKVSGRAALGAARFGLGFSRRRPVAVHVETVAALLDGGAEYALFASGALGLAWTAAGHLDGYLEAHLNAWDAAAGLVLVREAGGWTNDFFEGDGLADGKAIVAATPGLVEAVKACLPEAFGLS